MSFWGCQMFFKFSLIFTKTEIFCLLFCALSQFDIKSLEFQPFLGFQNQLSLYFRRYSGHPVARRPAGFVELVCHVCPLPPYYINRTIPANTGIEAAAQYILYIKFLPAMRMTGRIGTSIRSNLSALRQPYSFMHLFSLNYVYIFIPACVYFPRIKVYFFEIVCVFVRYLLLTTIISL